MRLALRYAALAVLAAGALSAQDLTGTCQGAFQAGKELRTVIKISKTDGVLRATLFSIDQGGGPGISSSSVTLQGSAAKILFPGIGGAYAGTLSADGNSIAGTWTQGAAPLTLNLQRVVPEAAWAIPEAPPRLKPMAADADPAFEVATVKSANPDAPGRGIGMGLRRLTIRNYTLSDLMAYAFSVQQRQISGGPAWFANDRFDIVGEPDGEGQPVETQWKVMLQKLLVDRFGLTFHRDKKELPVYALTAPKLASRLALSTGDPTGPPGFGYRGLGSLAARNASMGEFARQMQRAFLDRPVLDRTGLTGKYDFILEWTPDEFQFTNFGVKMPPPPGNGDAHPDLFTALQQQLGLKMESTRAPVDVLVIDKVGKPSEN